MIWSLYPVVGILLFGALCAVDIIDLATSDARWWLVVMVTLWPIATILLAWHGITVLRWKYRHRPLPSDTATTAQVRPGPARTSVKGQ